MWIGTIKYVAIAVIIAMLGWGINSWRSSISDHATLEYEKQQLQKALDESNKQLENLKKIHADELAEIEDLKKKNEKLDEDYKDLVDYLNSHQGEQDGDKPCFDKEGKPVTNQGSSTVLKRTIKELSGQP